eukprot:scaffold194205_cov35-Tisochrysis_lutea.AAC.2
MSITLRDFVTMSSKYAESLFRVSLNLWKRTTHVELLQVAAQLRFQHGRRTCSINTNNLAVARIKLQQVSDSSQVARMRTRRRLPLTLGPRPRPLSRVGRPGKRRSSPTMAVRKKSSAVFQACSCRF